MTSAEVHEDFRWRRSLTSLCELARTATASEYAFFNVDAAFLPSTSAFSAHVTHKTHRQRPDDLLRPTPPDGANEPR